MRSNRLARTDGRGTTLQIGDSCNQVAPELRLSVIFRRRDMLRGRTVLLPFIAALLAHPTNVNGAQPVAASRQSVLSWAAG